MVDRSIVADISRKRKQIAFHSVAYYELAVSLWDDVKYDTVCQELVSLQRDHPCEAALAQHSEAFADFTGDTGYHIPHHPDFSHYPEVVRRVIRTREQFS